MRNNSSSLLNRPHVSKMVLISCIAVWSGIWIVMFHSSYGSEIKKLNDKANFAFREKIGREAKLSKRIKIFGFDDKTISWIRYGGLTIEEWGEYIHAIDRKKPSAIYIDKLFAVDSVGIERNRNLKRIERHMSRKIKSPVIVGAYAYPRKVSGKTTLRLLGPDYQVPSLVKVPENLERFSVNRGEFVYGPAKKFQKIFPSFGHIQYDGDGHVQPILRVGANRVLPHQAFTGWKNAKFSVVNDELKFANRRVPVNRDGSMLINWVSKKEFYGNLYRAKDNISRGLRNLPAKNVNKGDIVVIIPNLFTGNTDFQQTPYGMLPGGAHIVSLLNSILTGKYIKSFDFVELVLLLMIIYGAFAGVRFSPRGFGVFLVVNLLVISGIGLALFGFKDISLSWIFADLAFVSASTTTFVFRSRDAEKKAHIIKSALDGVIVGDKLERISQKPGTLNLEARERVVTIMFVDVVGFSLLAENQIPKRAFEELKFSLSFISNVVYQLGGVVNKNLGDGLLCFFGYDFETDSVIQDHTEKALIAAIRIQEQNLQHNLKAASSSEMVFPLRIGLHTTSVFMGDLGSGSRIDFTVIGNGVNFAKRLEGACNPNSILMSHTTRDLASNLMLQPEAFAEKKIKIKHHSELVSTFEYDPFYNNKEIREQAEQAFRKCVKQARSEQRWTLSDSSLIRLMTNYGPGELINFSTSGMSVALQKSLVRGEQIVITIGSKMGELEHVLVQENLHQILCEVMWSYSENKGHVHGLRYTGLALEKADFLVEQIKEHGITKGGSILGTGPISRIGEAI